MKKPGQSLLPSKQSFSKPSHTQQKHQQTSVKPPPANTAASGPSKKLVSQTSKTGLTKPGSCRLKPPAAIEKNSTSLQGKKTISTTSNSTTVKKPHPVKATSVSASKDLKRPLVKSASHIKPVGSGTTGKGLTAGSGTAGKGTSMLKPKSAPVVAMRTTNGTKAVGVSKPLAHSKIESRLTPPRRRSIATSTPTKHVSSVDSPKSTPIPGGTFVKDADGTANQMEKKRKRRSMIPTPSRIKVHTPSPLLPSLSIPLPLLSPLFLLIFLYM